MSSGSPAKEVRASLRPVILSSLVPILSRPHGFPTYCWDRLPWGWGNVLSTGLSEPLGASESLGRGEGAWVKTPRDSPLETVMRAPLSSTPLVGPTCDSCSSSQGGSKSQMPRLQLGSIVTLDKASGCSGSSHKGWIFSACPSQGQGQGSASLMSFSCLHCRFREE